MPKRTILSIIAITIPAVLVSAVLSCPFTWVFSYSKLFGEKEIFTVAQEIRGNETDSKIILNGIAEWLSKYMTYDTSSSYYYPTFPFRLSRQTHPDPAWVMTVKRGACEEYAILCSARKRLAKKLQNPRLMKISFHTLRHWKATMLYHQTKDVIYVKEFLGHKKVETTLLCIQLAKTIFREDSDEFNVKVAKDSKEIQGLLEVASITSVRKTVCYTLGNANKQPKKEWKR